MRELVIRLRGLQDRTGLTQEELARETRYSTSSWGRWLNGEKLAPRPAVEALGRLARVRTVDLLRLVELWKVAELVYVRRASTPARPPVATKITARQPPAEAADEEVQRKPRSWRRRGVVVASALGVAALLAVLALVTPRLSGAVGGERSAVPANPPTASRTVYACRYSTHEGARYAGHSRTTTRMLELTSAEPAVVEVQCLLEQHGYSPGPIDGIYGERTRAAVKDLQRKAGLDADGVVGSNTWAVLRR